MLNSYTHQNPLVFLAIIRLKYIQNSIQSLFFVKKGKIILKKRLKLNLILYI